MDLRGHEFVFGYGALTALADGAAPSRTPAAGGFVCDLREHRRQWGVAMDNRRDLPGYKHYTDAAGDRPPVFVCFLDIAADAGSSVNGLCVPVDAVRLRALDVRERNYRRRDVSLRELRELTGYRGFRRFARQHWRTGLAEMRGSL